MRDGAEAPELWTPDWSHGLKQGERFLHVMLERWADGRGAVPGTIEEFAGRLGLGLSTARGYLATLVREGFVTRPARGRLPDGTMGPYCHWLNLEKLGHRNRHRQNSAVVELGLENLGHAIVHRQNSAVVEGVGPSSMAPVEERSAAAGNHRQNSAPPPPELSGGGAVSTGQVLSSGGGEGRENKGFEGVPRERARAFPFSNSFFLSFPWRDEASMKTAADILGACGPRIGGLGEQRDRVLLSLAYVLETGLWSEFDFEADVLPVVKLKTGPGQSRVLWDFALLTTNIAKHRRLRVNPEPVRVGARERPRASAASVVDPATQASTRMRGLRAIVAAVDRGEGQLFMLPKNEQRFTGEFLDDAYAALRIRCLDELEALELAAVSETAAAEGSA